MEPVHINAAKTIPAGFDVKPSESCGYEGYKELTFNENSSVACQSMYLKT